MLFDESFSAQLEVTDHFGSPIGLPIPLVTRLQPSLCGFSFGIDLVWVCTPQDYS